MKWLTDLLYGRKRRCEMLWKCSFCCHVDSFQTNEYRDNWRDYELKWAAKMLHMIALLRCEKCGIGSMYIKGMREFEV